MDQGLTDPHDKTHRHDFNVLVLPHLDSAYNLARWLTRNDPDADDLVQMAFVRAFRFFDSFEGDDARPWLLTIVRHTFFTVLRDQKGTRADVDFDEELHSLEDDAALPATHGFGASPEAALSGKELGLAVNQALAQLPLVYREVVVLRDMDELSYKEIAEIVDIPAGTVMSRLARARKMLAAALQGQLGAS
jgi:RNA polymerase sigma-70 factor (ECF subfamily)